MDTKLFARIGAGAFVAVALTMTVLDLREEPRVPPSQTATAFEPDGDPLPGQLRACAAMGELALSAPDCHAAWAEQRRRFLGADEAALPAYPMPPSPILDAPVIEQPPATEGN